MTIHFDTVAMQWVGIGCAMFVVGLVLGMASIFRSSILFLIGYIMLWAGGIITVLSIGGQMLFWIQGGKVG